MRAMRQPDQGRRSPLPGHPRLLEVDARSWLAHLSVERGRRIRLADVRERELDALLEVGFDLVWLMGAWERGSAGRRVARSLPWLREARARLLPLGSERDIGGSPFAIAGYMVAEDLGGDDGLAVLRQRLAGRGVGLILDFAPNHTALDHPWVRRHPGRYVQGSDLQRRADPGAYLETRTGVRRWVAHGRDPYFPPWTDTAQLDYRHPEVHEAMSDVLRQIATRCDGVRCDMAMLVLDDIFRSTWAAHPTAEGPELSTGEFWWGAIHSVREVYPSFLFIAEAYWDTEWRLQQLGFDYTYDKRLLDRLLAGDAPSVAAHLRADDGYQRRSVRFLENHDEPRVASLLEPDRHRAALLTAAAVPGMLLVQEGQADGARVRMPIQLVRRPEEPDQPAVAAFYRSILGLTHQPPFLRGTCLRLEPIQAWPGNESHGGVIARLWVGAEDVIRLVVSNLAGAPAQAYIPLALPTLAGRTVVVEDLAGDASFERDGDTLLSRGLYLDLPPYGGHVFRFESPRRAAGRSLAGGGRYVRVEGRRTSNRAPRRSGREAPEIDPP